MNIDFIQNVNVFTGGWWVFIWFIIFTILIAIISLTVVQTIEMMAARTKYIKPIFYTAILLAFATSVPELITGIDSSLLIDPQPTFAYFDNSGSNFMNLFTLSIFALGFSVYFDKKIINSFRQHKISRLAIVSNGTFRYQNNLVGRTFNTRNKDNVAIIFILVILNILIVLASYIPAFGNVIIPGLEISAISIIPIATWAIFLIYLVSKKTNKNDKPDINENSIWFKMPKFWLFVSFFILVGALLLVSILDADLVQAFSSMYHIDDVLSGGLILAFATGLPEFISNFYLFKRKKFTMVLESVVGSIWMNSLLMFFVDVSFRQDGLFHYANQMLALHSEFATYGGIEHTPLEIINNSVHSLLPWLNLNNDASVFISNAMKNSVMMGPWNIMSLVMVCFLPILITKQVGNRRWLGLSIIFLLFLAFIISFSVISKTFWNY